MVVTQKQLLQLAVETTTTTHLEDQNFEFHQHGDPARLLDHDKELQSCWGGLEKVEEEKDNDAVYIISALRTSIHHFLGVGGMLRPGCECVCVRVFSLDNGIEEGQREACEGCCTAS